MSGFTESVIQVSTDIGTVFVTVIFVWGLYAVYWY